MRTGPENRRVIEFGLADRRRIGGARRSGRQLEPFFVRAVANLVEEVAQ